ncbi:MAG: ATP synthase F1 subunit gamma [Candidatus Daviesbacteria bacterium]|nr:ATP synthase F1 subunit gamma [Candidatus Daviesbacteria bacterium]
MAKTRELRRRIKSVKNTSQITKAMQMVSATKMRRAQNKATESRPYTLTLTETLSRVAGKVQLESNPLLQTNTSKKVAVLLLTSDKGLCGSLNTNILRKLQTDDKLNGKEVSFYTIGRKGRDFLVRTGRDLVADFENAEKVDFIISTRIRKMLVEAYLKQELGEVYLLYPDFKSTLRQEPKLVQILPVEPVIANEVKQSGQIATSPSAPRNDVGEFLYEPNPAAVLDFALTHYIDTQIYQAMLETKASEHSARMIAMQNATNNAKELVEDLTLTYNQVRQGAITTELLEITSAAAALQ